jgi:hypothetical protein
MMPPQFSQKFNHNLTIKNSAKEKFSCFPTIVEEGPTELVDYSDKEKDDSLDNEDILSKSEEGEVDFETKSELDTEETAEDPAFTSIFLHFAEKRSSIRAICSMATVYSSRTCLPKFICSILVVELLTAGVLITGAYPDQDLLNQKLEFDNHTNSNTSMHNPE